MSRKQKAKTPQPQKGPKQHGMKTPQSAPAANKWCIKTADQNTLAQAKPTPKAGDKRKLDSSLAYQTPKKTSTPLVSAKEKNTPAKKPKTPQMIKGPGGKKTPQVKTPPSSANAKKTPQKQASDEDGDDDDDDDDDIDFEIDFDEDSEDDDDEESLEENMDDDDDDDDDDDGDDDDEFVPDEVAGVTKKGKGLKAAGAMNLPEEEDDDDDEDDDQNTACLIEMSDDDDDDDDDDDEDDDDDDEDDSDEDIDEDAILKSIQKLQEASGKQAAVGGKQKVKGMEKKAEQLPAPNKKQEKKENPNQKQQRQPEGGKQGQKTQDKVQKQPQPATKNKEIVKQAMEKKANKKQDKKGEQAAKVVVPDASNDAKRKEDHDKCTLFVKNLAPGSTTKDIKELSKDIKDVRLRITIRGKRESRTKTAFAFVEFASEALAEKNYKLLQGKSVKGSELLVDYVGQKSSFLAKNPKKETVDPDPLRLYITGFGGDVKDEDLYKLFPKAQEITVPVKKSDNLAFGYAFATFATPEQCKAAHKKGQGAKMHGHHLVVLYAKKRTQQQKKKDNKKKKSKSKENEKKKEKSQAPAKKAKLEVEEDDNDEDGEDDDDDSEGDGSSDNEGAGVMGASDDEDEEDSDEDDDDEDDSDDDE